MTTIMPDEVLFRGGKEKLIKNDAIEAIISLPSGLFYGTGIPACVLVVNKSKPDELRDKILFVNADREYTEGKAQNKLRPEDVEKIDFVFTHKKEYPQYSRLVSRQEIAEQHDYNLNIRRYMDNTPEPEDVMAHLIGGIPDRKIVSQGVEFARFGVEPERLFQPLHEGYRAFEAAIARHESVGKDSGLTSYIERLNNTFRPRISRLVRKTLSFSRKLENPIAALWNFIHDYNYQIRVEMLKSHPLEFSPSFT